MENASVLTVYPNPGNGSFTLELTVQSEGSLSIKVFDVFAREVFSSQEVTTSGIFTKQLDLTELSSGTYFVKVTHGGESEIRKLFIEK